MGPMIPQSFLRAVLILALAVGTSGAQGGQPRSPMSRTVERVVVTIRDTSAHVYHEDSGGIADSLRLVIGDSASFTEFWNRLVRTKQPNRLPPVIDFGKHSVIVAALGARGASGPRISIDTVRVQSDVRYVVVRRVLPHEHCMDFTQGYELGRPVDVVVVPRDSVRTTRFIERVVHLSDCGRP
jgi:hypothetical protein